MLRKLTTKTGIVAVLTVVLLLGILTVGTVLAQSPDEGQAGAIISTTDAEAIALEANPGVSVVDTELEKENGVLVYGVELSNGKEVKIDANTGVILQTELEDKDDTDVDNKDDGDGGEQDEDNDDVEDEVEEENEDGAEADEGIEDDAED